MLFIGNRIAYCILTARNSAPRPSPRNRSTCVHSHRKLPRLPSITHHYRQTPAFCMTTIFLGIFHNSALEK